MQMRIYIAHPSKLRKDVQQIMKYITKHIDVLFVNPFNHPYTNEWNSGNNSRTLAFKIVEKDLTWINSSDIVVAIYPEEGIGTCHEIWYAGKEKGKTVIVLTNHVNHPWLQFCNAITVKSKEELVMAIKGLLPWRD